MLNDTIFKSTILSINSWYIFLHNVLWLGHWNWPNSAFVYLERPNPCWEGFHLTARAALICWQGSSLFLSFHPSNTLFYFSLYYPLYHSPLHHLTSLLTLTVHLFFVSVVPLDLFDGLMYGGLWNTLFLSMVFALLLFFFCLQSLNQILKWWKMTEDLHGFPLIWNILKNLFHFIHKVKTAKW